MKCDTVIVIPYYKEKINYLERISLIQMMKVLGEFKKVFLIPDKIKNVDVPIDSTCQIIICPNEWFASTVSYSKTLLSPYFYDVFIDYEYMLIHQLDAFVFKNELEKFCQLGYDYIGAPWFRSSRMYEYSNNFVGNGGLSLRHIKRTKRLLEDNDKIIKDEFIPKLGMVGEDVVFSWLGANAKAGYAIATIDVSKQFSLECDFQKAYKYLEAGLPFGCHHWWNEDFDVWKNYVKKQGYDIEDNYSYTVEGGSRDARIAGISRYLLKRILKQGERDKINEIVHEYIGARKRIVIWGYGVLGKRCLSLLQHAGISVDCIIDTKFKEDTIVSGIKASEPNIESLSREETRIIISANRYYNDIAANLRDVEFKENVDFFSYIKIERYVALKYYESFWPNYNGKSRKKKSIL